MLLVAQFENARRVRLRVVPYQGGGGQAPALQEFAATGQNCRRSQTSPRYRNSPVRRCQDARHDAICSGSTGLKPVLLAHRALPLASLTARAPYERLPSGSYTQFPYFTGLHDPLQRALPSAPDPAPAFPCTPPCRSGRLPVARFPGGSKDCRRCHGASRR